MTVQRTWSCVGGAAFVVAGVMLAQSAGWVPAHPAAAFAGVLLAAVITSGLTRTGWTAQAGGVMPPSFVLTFAALLVYGPHGAALVAVAATLAPPLLAAPAAIPRIPVLIDALSVLIAAEGAGAALEFAEGALGTPAWPWRALPMAAAALAYRSVLGAAAGVVVPFLSRRTIDAQWAAQTFAAWPAYLVGAAAAAGLVALVEHHMWKVLPVAGVSLGFACRMYVDYTRRIEEEALRGSVVASLHEGLAVLDRDGTVTSWSDTLERLTGCTRERAIGRSLVAAVPEIGKTELPHALKAVTADQSPRVVPQVTLASGTSVTVLEVRIVPIPEGIALVWEDVTERIRAEQDSRRAEERLTLAAEGANDGLWQWDLRTQEFYVSGRWRSMMGLPPESGVGGPEQWLQRVHPEDVADLRAALEAHLAGQTEVFLHEHRILHEDGTYRRFLCRGLGVKGAGRRRYRIAGSLTDTTEQALAQERLRSVGVLDPLTGLLNRAIFVEGLGRRLDDFKHRRVRGWFAVLYLDLDRFKIVNDSLGHLVGDELLIGVSRRLESCIRPGDALARLGGDEFVILLNGLNDEAQANAVAHRIQQSLSAPFSIGGREAFTSASIGIAFGPAHYTNPDDMMRDADTAMYHAKAHGKARHEMFDADMHARVRDRLSLENDLRRAISSNDFEVHYQPIVSLTSRMCVGFESLVRWKRNDEPVSPATFIPIAEELGLIVPLGTWILQQACHTFAEWQRRFPAAALDCITVNVSSRQLMQHNFVRVVEQAVMKSGLRPADLRLEITETALMDTPGEAAEVLRDLRNFGVKVYLDDFGTGYSSLSHLHKLPVDALKIDRSFVKSLLLPNRPAIVESILALARTLNTSVVAEGIETHVQALELQRLGCTHAQGFLFSRPISTQAVEQLLQANQPLGTAPPAIPAGVHGWDPALDPAASGPVALRTPHAGASAV